MGELPKLHSFCWACGWRKSGPDSWNGKACKCGHYDTVALETTRKIEAIFADEHKGGDVQRWAKIQCAIRDAFAALSRPKSLTTDQESCND